MSARDWNAAVYDRVSDPQFQWGVQLLDRLPTAHVTSALDAGCGSGRVTAELAKRLPGARILACDAAPSMVALAREHLPPEIEVFECDLVELELDERVDLIVSTAVFHWIPDHDRLFQRLHAALAGGGRLIAQCGGTGNVADLHAAIARVARTETVAHYLEGWRAPWNFQDPASTHDRLAAAGFREIRTWLEPKRVEPPDPHAFAATVTLGHHLERLPEELRDRFVDEVIRESGEPFVLEYVRLNIEATA